MFTGIIEELGTVVEVLRGTGAGLAVSAPRSTRDLRPGDSVAVNGVCLTATRVAGDRFDCDLSSETLARTALGGLGAGTRVNIERPLAVGGRLGGHFVLGHVDGVGRLLDIVPDDGGCTVRFGFPVELARYLVWKGSIAVDGISLTIARLEPAAFTVAVIPHTLRATNLGARRPGETVNLEVDVLGKYFERYVELGQLAPAAREEPARRSLTVDYLKEQGF